jgi:predicted NAD/FAD-binding protein
VFQTFTYAHPQFTRDAFTGQALLRQVNGRNRVWMAGAWTGYGFHEDGLRSGLEAAEGIGAVLPWRVAPAEAAE